MEQPEGPIKNGGDSQHSNGLSFDDMVAFFVDAKVLQARLQVWKTKYLSMGGKLEDHVSRRLTHVFAASLESLTDRIDSTRLKKLRKLKVMFLKYDWFEDCLKAGHNLPSEPYNLLLVATANSSDESGDSATESLNSDVENPSIPKTGKENTPETSLEKMPNSDKSDKEQQKAAYTPPNLNQNITGPFEELKNIYKDALGDDRRSFSYYKAISAVEKLPFKIRRASEVKNVPNVGKSMQEHIHEILTTGKLSKLEHFKEDEKVKTVTLFGSIWGFGPASALKFYEKGHRTLDDLAHEESLTRTQRIGLQFFDDIRKKIPLNEARDMEELVQQKAEAIQPGVLFSFIILSITICSTLWLNVQISVVCGGSYRRGKAFIGDMDMIVTHSDGVSHKGFLKRLVEKLKEMDFLTEDLLISYHEENDDGVDTYFGLCKYPGREQRHRIDFKVYSAQQYPFGLIAWTGNDVLNRRLRILADEKGYKLDDKGLFRAVRDSKRNKVANKNVGVPCKNERELFDFLGFPWLEPHQRNL